MVSIEVIGNLGADVRRVDYQGTSFYTFSVCDNRKVGEKEVSMWYKCNLNRVSENLLQYLVKGQQVFVRGIPRYSIFDSSVHHCKMVSVDIMVNEIQLVGGNPGSKEEGTAEQGQDQEQAQEPAAEPPAADAPKKTREGKRKEEEAKIF